MDTNPRQITLGTEIVMGLPFSIHVRGPVSLARATRAVVPVWAELRRYDRIFSTYRVDSDIRRIGRGDLRIADADPAVRVVLDLAAEAYWMSHGAFDINVSGRLDPSGVVKGWAAERACHPLYDLGVDFYCNAGGDILLHTNELPWRIGIEHPANPAALMVVFESGSGAIATSGRAHRGAHILDSDGRPARGVTQATVLGPALTWADILATAVVAEGRTHPETDRWPPGYDIALVTEDGDLAATPGAVAAMAPDVPRPPVHYRLRPAGPDTPTGRRLTESRDRCTVAPSDYHSVPEETLKNLAETVIDDSSQKRRKEP